MIFKLHEVSNRVVHFYKADEIRELYEMEL